MTTQVHKINSYIDSSKLPGMIDCAMSIIHLNDGHRFIVLANHEKVMQAVYKRCSKRSAIICHNAADLGLAKLLTYDSINGFKIIITTTALYYKYDWSPCSHILIVL